MISINENFSRIDQKKAFYLPTKKYKNKNMASNNNVFEQNVRNLCASFTQQISDYLRENKNCDCPPEELCAAMNLPVRPASTPGMTGSSVTTKLPTLNAPDYFNGSVSPAKKKGGRGKKVANSNLPKCQYKKTRGNHPGSTCENTVLGDGSLGADRYCKACLTKAAVKKELNGETSTKSKLSAPSLGNVVNISEDEPSSSNSRNEINCVPLEGEPGRYRETNYGFIVEQHADAGVVVIEIEDNGVRRELNDNERKLASGLGLQTLQPKPTPAAVNIQIPQLPSISLPRV